MPPGEVPVPFARYGPKGHAGLSPARPPVGGPPQYYYFYVTTQQRAPNVSGGAMSMTEHRPRVASTDSHSLAEMSVEFLLPTTSRLSRWGGPWTRWRRVMARRASSSTTG